MPGQNTNKLFAAGLANFRTLNTSETPLTMKDDEVPILLNFMPIGKSLWTVPGYSDVLAEIGTAEAAWQSSHTYVANSVVRPVVANGFTYMVTAGGGGSSAGSEPTWPTTNLQTVSDGALTWTAYDCTVKRIFTVNLSGVLFHLFATIGGAIYRLDGSYNQLRLCLPGIFTDPKFEQWKFIYGLIVDPVAGYYSFNGTNAAFSVAGTAIATTKTKVKFTNSISYSIGNTMYSKVATDNFWTLTGFNCGQGYYNKCYLYIDNAGIASIGIGTQGITEDVVVLPTIDTTKAILGILSINCTGTGNFTGGTTDLDDGTVVPNATFVDNTLLKLIDATVKGNCIAIWKTRVWIGTGIGRGLLFSGSDLYNDFSILNGGGVLIDNYPSLRNQIMNLAATQDYLYVCGDHATHIVFGLQISATGSTSFNLIDALPTVGAIYPETVQVIGKNVLMMGDYGVHEVNAGSEKFASKYLEGLIPTLDLSFTPISFMAKIFNRLCYCLVVKLPNPVDGTKQKWILALYEGRWFPIFFGQDIDLAYAYQNATLSDTLSFAAYGNKIIQLFTGFSPMVHKVRTKAQEFGKPLDDKQVLKVGATLANFIGAGGVISAKMSAIGSGSQDQSATGIVPMIQFYPALMNWINGSNQPLIWYNGLQLFDWFLGNTDMDNYASCDGRGKRIQIDYEETSANQYILTSLYVEGQIGASY